MKKTSSIIKQNMVVKEESVEFSSLGKGKKKRKNLQYNTKTDKKKNFRSGRLIVRNLSFKSNEDSIKKHFSKFGEISEVNILKKGNKLVGCCFIQFKDKLGAAKAIAKLSGQPFLGRPIIVDWALPKDKFNKTIKKELGSAEEKSVKEEPKQLDSDDDEESSESEEEEVIKSEDEASIKSEDEASIKSEDEASIKSEEEESDRSDSESMSSTENKVKKPKEKIIQKKNTNKKFHFQYDPQDVDDGRTVFLKNVPFSVNDEDLLKCAEEIGPVVYAVVCMDNLTEHSKGTAFVKFNEKSVAEDLICGKSKLVLKGVKLDAYLALKKNQILQNSEKKHPKDNRNLYLLREGVILAGSPAAEGVSEGDMSKRLQLEHWKTQTLRNLTKFVSTHRLVIHNIPPFYDDNRLRKMVQENSPKGTVITEVRIIRNLRDLDEKGNARSKGFGFVTFAKHEHALEALRKINNNPQIFNDSKRPIVGFSIENRGALRLKERRKAKSQNPPPKQIGDNVKKSHTLKPDNKKRKFSKINDGILPEYCGYTAKPGAKKMRSGKELKVQAALHHKALVDKKRFQKGFRFAGKRKNNNFKKQK